MLSKTIRQQLTVSWEFPVVFTHGLFAAENPVLLDAIDRLDEGRRHRVMAFIDGAVAKANPDLTGKIEAYAAARSKHLELAAPPQILSAGEALKNDFTLIERLMQLLLEKRMDRHAVVLAIGG